jgi:glycine oxidase
MATIPTDVLIIGGGITGCAIAYYLRQSNVDVTVLDQGEIGAQASRAAAGLLAPLGSLSGPGPLADLLLASWAIFPKLVPELEGITGLTTLYHQTGALRIVRNPKNIANLRKRMLAWEPLGLTMHWLSGSEARQREPLLASDVSAAIYAPQEGQIKAPLLTSAFAQAATQLGAKLHSHRQVLSIQHSGNKVISVRTAQGETIACNHLVLANGAWANSLGQLLQIELPVAPQRGQILSLQQPSTPLQHIIFGEALYLAPKQDNTIVVGATKEDVGFDSSITVSGVSWLLNSALQLVPALANCSINEIWAGLRPKTPDNLPILGKAPGWENVTVAVGHGSVGIMLSPITGKCIAELVVTREISEILKPFSAERFNR